MNFQFILVKPAETGFSLFLEQLFLYFYQFFSAKCTETACFRRFKHELKVHGQQLSNLLSYKYRSKTTKKT